MKVRTRIAWAGAPGGLRHRPSKKAVQVAAMFEERQAALDVTTRLTILPRSEAERMGMRVKSVVPDTCEIKQRGYRMAWMNRLTPTMSGEYPAHPDHDPMVWAYYTPAQMRLWQQLADESHRYMQGALLDEEAA